MSYTETRHPAGLPFGGIPHDELLLKLEETDPDLVMATSARARGRAGEPGDYDDYARAVLTDWGPDAVYLESDHARRDEGISRSALNLRYNGTRGSSSTGPQHPEIFYGFTDPDPRGTSTDPRFNEVRGQMTTRVGVLTARMGDNDANSVAERPWTGQSISYGMKELHRRVKDNTKVFIESRVNHPAGSNVAAGAGVWGATARDLRGVAVAHGTESLAQRGASRERFAGGDHQAVDDASSGGLRGVDACGTTDSAPWRHSLGGAPMGVQRYGPATGAGRAVVGAAAQGGGKAAASRADQDFDDGHAAPAAHRRQLAATMAVAARSAAAGRGADTHEHDASESFVAKSMPGAGLVAARDVAHVYRRTTGDQQRGNVIDDSGAYALGGARGLTPAAHPERALRRGGATTSATAHLADAAAVALAARAGTSAGYRRAAGAGRADGVRPGAVAEARAAAGKTAARTDGALVARLTSLAPAASGGADGLEVRVYGTAAPQREDRVARGAAATAPETFRGSREAPAVGASQAPGAWRSATTGQTTLGDAAAAVFGHADVADVATSSAGTLAGPKRLRAGGWSREAAAVDLDGFSGAPGSE